MAQAMQRAHNKYGVSPASERTYRGWTFASKAEARHARQLDIEKRAGEVMEWFRQVPVDLTDDDRVRIDFLVIRKTGIVFEEIKGKETREWSRVKRLWRKYGPFPCKVIRNGRTIEVLYAEDEAPD